jgi:hypothetical protein
MKSFLSLQGEADAEESDDEDEGRRPNVNDKYVGVNVSNTCRAAPAAALYSMLPLLPMVAN